MPADGVERIIRLRARVRERTNWLWRFLTVDSQAADAMIGALEDLLTEAARDPNHALRIRVNEIVARFADELKNDPVTHGLMIDVRFDRDGVAGVTEIPVVLNRNRTTCPVENKVVL